MLRLRPYKRTDAEKIVTWIGDERQFHWWSADRFEHYPITADDLNAHYDASADNFFMFTAFDEEKIVGHMIMRYPTEDKSVIRFGFVILDPKMRGKGIGKEMIMLAGTCAREVLKAKKATLGVFEENEGAYHCYRAAGFQLSKTKEPYYYHVMGEDLKCLEMELEL